MCGIFGIITNKENTGEKIREALEILEYRGYDSAGIAIINEEKFTCKCLDITFSCLSHRFCFC